MINIFVAIITIAPIFFNTGCIGNRSHTGATIGGGSSADLEFSPHYPDFGKVAVGTTNSMSFTLRNINPSQTIENINFSLPHPFALLAQGTVNHCGQKLSPNQSCTMEISIGHYYVVGQITKSASISYKINKQFFIKNIDFTAEFVNQTISPKPLGMWQKVYDLIVNHGGAGTNITEKNTLIAEIDTAIKLGAVRQRDNDIRTAVTKAGTKFIGLDNQIINLLLKVPPKKGGGKNWGAGDELNTIINDDAAVGTTDTQKQAIADAIPKAKNMMSFGRFYELYLQSVAFENNNDDNFSQKIVQEMINQSDIDKKIRELLKYINDYYISINKLSKDNITGTTDVSSSAAKNDIQNFNNNLPSKINAYRTEATIILSVNSNYIKLLYWTNEILNKLIGIQQYLDKNTQLLSITSITSLQSEIFKLSLSEQDKVNKVTSQNALNDLMTEIDSYNPTAVKMESFFEKLKSFLINFNYEIYKANKTQLVAKMTKIGGLEDQVNFLLDAIDAPATRVANLVGYLTESLNDMKAGDKNWRTNKNIATDRVTDDLLNELKNLGRNNEVATLTQQFINKENLDDSAQRLQNIKDAFSNFKLEFNKFFDVTNSALKNINYDPKFEVIIKALKEQANIIKSYGAAKGVSWTTNEKNNLTDRRHYVALRILLFAREHMKDDILDKLNPIQPGDSAGKVGTNMSRVLSSSLFAAKGFGNYGSASDKLPANLTELSKEITTPTPVNALKLTIDINNAKNDINNIQKQITQRKITLLDPNFFTNMSSSNYNKTVKVPLDNKNYDHFSDFILKEFGSFP